MVENKIKQAIVTGEMADKIPGERALAKQFGVSYMTARKAIENLVAENYLYRVASRGTYVVERHPVKSLVRNIGRFFENRVS